MEILIKRWFNGLDAFMSLIKIHLRPLSVNTEGHTVHIRIIHFISVGSCEGILDVGGINYSWCFCRPEKINPEIETYYEIEIYYDAVKSGIPKLLVFN